ncbi:hypothetical protein V4F39_26615 [Aquincola sp. MAHUQ-54]|uniref:Uncharacterized protein n=1 Tax=Aquincola agrisoli TaxID=3119538 RepID=A0AAW9QJU0_9BURK
MTHSRPSVWAPIITAFAIWFVHFMVCWVATEIWSDRWPANATAWVATAVALAAVGVHFMRIAASHQAGRLPGWSFRFAQGATAIAGAAIVFSVVPSLVIVP